MYGRLERLSGTDPAKQSQKRLEVTEATVADQPANSKDVLSHSLKGPACSESYLCHHSTWRLTCLVFRASQHLGALLYRNLQPAPFDTLSSTPPNHQTLNYTRNV